MWKCYLHSKILFCSCCWYQSMLQLSYYILHSFPPEIHLDCSWTNLYALRLLHYSIICSFCKKQFCSNQEPVFPPRFLKTVSLRLISKIFYNISLAIQLNRQLWIKIKYAKHCDYFKKCPFKESVFWFWCLRSCSNTDGQLIWTENAW